MESINRDCPLLPSRILIVFDATKNRSSREFRNIINNVRMRGRIVHPADTILVLGVLDRILHPMGYQMAVAPENFLGTTHIRAIEEVVLTKVDRYLAMLQHSAEECEEEGVDIEIKITAGTPKRKVIIQEVATSNAAWVIFDRHLRKELAFYLKHIPCKVAMVLDNLTVDVLRHRYSNMELEYIEDKQFYSLSKPVPLPPVSDEINEQSVITISYHESMDVSKSSLISTVISKEQSFSSQAEYRLNLKQEEPGLERGSSHRQNRESFSWRLINRCLRQSAIKSPRAGEITLRNH